MMLLRYYVLYFILYFLHFPTVHRLGSFNIPSYQTFTIDTFYHITIEQKWERVNVQVLCYSMRLRIVYASSID